MNSMFCFQCQETCGNAGCTKTGVCGKTSATANAMDRLIRQLKLIAMTKKPNHAAVMFVARSLFMTVTNTVFSEKSVVTQLRRAEKLTGVSGCNVPLGVHSDGDEDICSMREFILYALKGISAYMVHADNLGKFDESLDDFLFRALKMCVESRDMAELGEFLNECGSAAVKAMALLDEANTENFGSPEKTAVRTSAGQRGGILVSGHDLKDLYELLILSEGKNIDIYTHGEMLAAHAYPVFKQFPHLYGHYGSAWHRQNVEFETFNGAILLTSNCITPIQESYSRRIFSTGCCHYPGVTYIEAAPQGMLKDFTPLIEIAQNSLPPAPLKNSELVIGFAHDQLDEYFEEIVENVRNENIRRFIVLAGCDGRQKKREYYADIAANLPLDTIILTAGCAKYRYNEFSLGEINGIPRLLDAGQCNDAYSLAVFALKLKERLGYENINQLPIAFDIAWYEQKAVAILLALLSLGFKNIRLGPTLPAFVSPRVMRYLEKNCKLKPISSCHDDINSMLHGR